MSKGWWTNGEKLKLKKQKQICISKKVSKFKNFNIFEKKISKKYRYIEILAAQKKYRDTIVLPQKTNIVIVSNIDISIYRTIYRYYIAIPAQSHKQGLRYFWISSIDIDTILKIKYRYRKSVWVEYRYRKKYRSIFTFRTKISTRPSNSIQNTETYNFVPKTRKLKQSKSYDIKRGKMLSKSWWTKGEKFKLKKQKQIWISKKVLELIRIPIKLHLLKLQLKCFVLTRMLSTLRLRSKALLFALNSFYQSVM